MDIKILPTCFIVIVRQEKVFFLKIFVNDQFKGKRIILMNFYTLANNIYLLPNEF